MRELTYLVPLLPGEGRDVPVGRRVRWPGEDSDWVWDGQRWVAKNTAG